MEDINYRKIFKKTKKSYQKLVERYYKLLTKTDFFAWWETRVLREKIAELENILYDLEEKAYYQDKMEKGIYQEDKRSKRK